MCPPFLLCAINKSIHYLHFFILTAFLSIQLNTSASAQAETDPEEGYSKEYVNLDGYNLFYVRGIASYPAKERAKAIAERIKLIADDPSVSPNSIVIINEDVNDDISINGTSLLKVFDSDAALEGVSRESFSAGAKVRIIKAIYQYRYERSYDALLKHMFYSIGAILLAALIILLTHFLSKKVNILLESKLKAKLEKIETRSFQLIRSNQVWVTMSGLISTIKFILVIITVFITTQYIFGLFPWTRFISVSLFSLFTQPFGAFGNALIKFIPDLAFLVVIFFITKYLLKIVKLLFSGLSLGNITISGFEPEWAITSYKIARLLLIAFAVIVAYPYIPGSDSEAFKGVSLFLGVLFSLGSTSVIANLVAGYTMTYRKTFKIGDIVQIDAHTGQVSDVKLFITRLRTTKNEEVIIPNSIVLNTNVVNYSTLSSVNGLILHTSVGIGYETPWRQVDAMLKLAAERTTGVLRTPEPFVLQRSLGDFSISYELNAYTMDPVNRLNTYSELHQNILDVFNENHVQIMTPAYEADPEKPKIVPKDQWFTPVSGKDPIKEPGTSDLIG